MTLARAPPHDCRVALERNASFLPIVHGRHSSSLIDLLYLQPLKASTSISLQSTHPAPSPYPLHTPAGPTTHTPPRPQRSAQQQPRALLACLQVRDAQLPVTPRRAEPPPAASPRLAQT